MQFQQNLQQNGQTLPPIPHLLSTGSTPSFQLTAAAPVAPAAMIKSETISAVPGDRDSYSLTQQLVTPTSPVLGYVAQNIPGQHQHQLSSPSQPQPQPQQPLLPQQQPLHLLNIPIGHAYTYHPSSEHSQTTGLIFHNNPITPTASGQHILSALSSTQAPTKSRPPRNKSKFKRFRNAFIFFVNDQRPKVDDEAKRLKNREFLQLMSARWKGMSESERSPYVKLAEDDKKRFNEDVKKYGKYESRQRRYSKSRHVGKDFVSPGNPYGMTGAHQYPNTAAGFLCSGGYAAMAAQPTQEQGHAAAAAASFPTFYVGLPAGQKENTSLTNWQPSTAPGIATGVGAVQPQVPPTQPNTLLCPPGLLTQRTSLSSTGSSSELNEIQQGSVNPRLPWLPAAAPSPSGQIETRKYNAYYQQYQPPTSGYMQVPTGAPISHSLTEPVFTGDNHALPQISVAMQARIQNNHMLAQQQQQQALQVQNYPLV
ncbi:hypothetical protein GGI20_003647 [Coemansia sp. BCRC 34301]|nr:hypothetical protein GGI20_003647 [Coemansia sp. BCRC 34301]